MPQTYRFIQLELNDQHAVLILNRPEKRNALHHDMLQECLTALHLVESQKNIRAVLITATGSDFCAGADIQWMQSSAVSDFETNVKEAELLADLIYLLYTYSKPVITLAKGASMGGALGILAASDVVFAESHSVFALPEVKIGLIPAIVSPYLIQTMGERWTRYYCLTGELFSAQKALELQLIHRITTEDELFNEGLTVIHTLMDNAPNATSLSKLLIRKMHSESITTALSHDNAVLLARTRASKEAQRGIQSFLQKKKPDWRGKA